MPLGGGDGVWAIGSDHGVRDARKTGEIVTLSRSEERGYSGESEASVDELDELGVKLMSNDIVGRSGAEGRHRER